MGPDWPLKDPLINVLNDSEWPEEKPDTEWEAAEAEYGENAIVYVGKGAVRKVNGGEDEVKVEKEDETIASETLIEVVGEDANE